MARHVARGREPYRELLHLLNQRYQREWVRAELLANELAAMKGSRLWRVVSWVRRLLPFRPPAAPRVTEEAVPYTPLRIRPPAARVTIVIPFRDQPDLLRNCLRSLRRGTYRRFDVVLVNNGSTDPRGLRILDRLRTRSRVRVADAPGPFNFSRLCNLGASHATGEHLLFLNNDTEVLARRWLDHLLRLAADPAVGVVGATLLYPGRTIQHAGLFPRSDGLWVHPHQGEPLAHRPELSRPRAVPAVTGACLMIRRQVFAELGGFDERLPVAYNDVDLCLRVRRRGLLVVVSPGARLVHYAGLSRGCSADAPPDPH
ncbi:MAG: glycosyltransferase family 2 protein [Gemmataceae bacterium]|nr:glycosyltransferase family 2 protein [Gemmataceae bacterium]